MVIPDSDIWIDLLNDPELPASQSLAELVDEGEAALVGLVIAEVLRGARKTEEAAILDILSRLGYLEMNRASWLRAGRIAAELERKGQTIPMTDVLLAAITLEGHHELFTRDKHFSRIPGLRLYVHKKGGTRA